MYALERDDLLQVNYGDSGVAADSWLHPSFPQYGEIQPHMTRYHSDVRMARSLLEDAGWRFDPNGAEKSGQQFNLTMRDGDGEQDALIIAASWKAIGVKGTYEPRRASRL